MDYVLTSLYMLDLYLVSVFPKNTDILVHGPVIKFRDIYTDTILLFMPQSIS